MIALIAYSNNAQSDKVTLLVNSGIFGRVFHEYSIGKTAALSAEQVRGDHWSELKDIRFKSKIDAMITSAKCLQTIRAQHTSFMDCLAGVALPRAITSERDIAAFWEAFSGIRAYFRELKLPYFANLTSLCHLLMDLGFDCAKPDLAVMKAAVELGIVPAPPSQKKNPAKSSAHPEESLRTTIEALQSYAVHRNTRAPVMDLYFLIRGGQFGVKTFVQDKYYGSAL